MTLNVLVACLRSYARPAGVEEWVQVAGPPQAAEPVVPEAYRQAVHDLLVGLGIIDSETGAYSSPMAYYFVQSLISTLHDAALTPQSWLGVPGDPCTGIGAQLVRLLESHRADCVPLPTPLRSVSVVMAIIKAQRGDDDAYLMQYDRGARQFQPIGGKREAFDASNEAALTREICEELAIDALTPGEDFIIQPLIEHARVNTISASLHILTQYDHSFYHLRGVRFRLDTDSDTRWITAAEVAAGRTRDGLAITPLIAEHLRDLLPGLSYSLPEIVE